MRYPIQSRFQSVLRRLLAVTAAAALTIVAAPSAAQPADRVDVALEWWDVSNAVMTPPNGPTGVEHYRAWAITWLAAARAVNTHRWGGPARHHREAAFAAAVHESLASFVPARRAELDQALATTLSRIPDGRAESHGVAAGRAEARLVLADRAGDGLDRASVSRPFTPPASSPGIWRPTPPGFVPALWPGLGDARPFTMRSPDQYRPGPPPAAGSERYRADWTEVRDVGSVDSTVRTADQTAAATFIYFAPPHVYHPAIRAALQELSGSLKQQAEFLAVARLTLIDTAIAVWEAKYTYLNWRPITAIREAGGDGDPATTPDPNWTPLHVTPPHPDYLSGHAGLMGSLVEALKAYTGDGPSSPVTLTSPATPGLTRTYASWDQMDQETIDARVWSGIHSRTADVVAAEVGRKVTLNILRNSHRLFD